MLSKQLEEGFDNPQTQVEYDIFSVCSDIKRLCDDFDKDKAPEAFLNQQTVEELTLAHVRLESLIKAVSYYRSFPNKD